MKTIQGRLADRKTRRLNVVFREFGYKNTSSFSEAFRFAEDHYQFNTHSTFWERCQKAMDDEEIRKDDELLAKYK